jgi:hypothetical protein
VATELDLTMHEDNDETVVVTLTAADGDNLGLVTGLEFVLKPSWCDADDDDHAVVLTSPGDITITEQTAETLSAEVSVPAAALADPYDRVWRLDTMTGLLRRTALYGAVTVVDL